MFWHYHDCATELEGAPQQDILSKTYAWLGKVTKDGSGFSFLQFRSPFSRGMSRDLVSSSTSPLCNILPVYATHDARDLSMTFTFLKGCTCV